MGVSDERFQCWHVKIERLHESSRRTVILSNISLDRTYQKKMMLGSMRQISLHFYVIIWVCFNFTFNLISNFSISISSQYILIYTRSSNPLPPFSSVMSEKGGVEVPVELHCGLLSCL